MELSVDSEVGTIVWVRRRNGSWWPGKILGGEELSASHLMSPRSGTPVKLLGREDASVDWYNLEKSKRVKPFRCGEFDHCIQRAQASQGMPPKKREKYARREDAILHALELEKQLLHNKYPTPVPLNTKPPSDHNDEQNVDLSPQDDTTIQRKKPRHEEDDEYKEPIIQPTNPMPLLTHPPLLLVEDNKTQVAVTTPPEMAAAAAATVSGDSSDHTPDHLLKPSAEEQSMQLQLNKEHDESFDYNQTPISDWVEVSTPKSQNAFTYGLSEENNTTEDDHDDDEDDEDEEEDTETDSSGTESISSDTYDATLSVGETTATSQR
nr:putative PWWP domain-containing protein [Tanacetum cinerariifolium]